MKNSNENANRVAAAILNFTKALLKYTEATQQLILANQKSLQAGVDSVQASLRIVDSISNQKYVDPFNLPRREGKSILVANNTNKDAASNIQLMGSVIASRRQSPRIPSNYGK